MNAGDVSAVIWRTEHQTRMTVEDLGRRAIVVNIKIAPATANPSSFY